MNLHTATVKIKTNGFNDVLDITSCVNNVLSSSNLKDGILVVFVSGSTAGLTTIEYESGVVEDLKNAIERLAPQSITYNHDARWGDGNGFSHVRASLIGPSLSIPFNGGQLELGTWQQIVLIDFDNRPRTREVRIQIIGK